MLVYKFGGASVKDAEGVKNLAKVVSLNQEKGLLIVISAMGKTTNALEDLANAYVDGKETEHIFTDIKSYHDGILNALFDDQAHQVYDEVANTFVEIEWILEEAPQDDYGFIYDQIVSIGELVSTRIVSAYLNHIGINNRWLDARSYVHTDNSYREGQVDWERTRNAVLQADLTRNNQIYVTQGFIGGTSENYTTTLGREGSDYTAAIFATCLGAESVTIWKDVQGVLNADPKLFPDTKKYDELSYFEALEMTYYGATVIHPKTIKPLQNASIPLFVKPFMAPLEPGTIIHDIKPAAILPAIIVKSNQAMISLSTKDHSFITEAHLSDIFRVFAESRIHVNVLQNSAITISVCFDWDERRFKKFFDKLDENYRLKYNTGLQLITVRHYQKDIIQKLTSGKTVLLEQLNRNTAQYVVKSVSE